MPLNEREYFDFITHAFGGIATIVGLVFLLIASWENLSHIIISTIYGCSLVFLFTASALYHFYKKKKNEDTWRRKVDHIAIFFMIAGSYTPICYLYFTGLTRWGIIIAQWSIAFSAIIIKPKLMNNKKGIDEIIYLIMGWMAIFAVKQIIENMTWQIIIISISGGLMYTIGAVLNALRKPQPIKGVIGSHEIFHILVLVGGSLHYLAIYFGIKSIF